MPTHPPLNIGANARAGGTFLLATLYLLRDPTKPEDATLLRRQHEWWPLWATIAQPGADLASLGIELRVNLDETASIEAWTV
jgi:hypothetical protein